MRFNLIAAWLDLQVPDALLPGVCNPLRPFIQIYGFNNSVWLYILYTYEYEIKYIYSKTKHELLRG